MNQQATAHTTLYEILSRTWTCPAAVGAVAFCGGGGTALFALADGSLALVPTADDEPPDQRIRVSADIGRSTIRPRKAPLPPLRIVPGPGAALPLVVACGEGAFLVGGATGDVLEVTADGERRATALRFDAPVVALDHAAATGITVASDGATVLTAIAAAEPIRTQHPAGAPVGVLTLSPDGRRLATAAGDALTVSTIGDAAAVPDFTVTLPSRAVAAAWRADGRWLAVPLQEGGFGLVDVASRTSSVVGGFPSPVRTAVFSTPADAVVTSGAFRITAWSMASPPLGDGRSGALDTGSRGFVAVERVAAHPKRKLVAAAYENGQIVLARFGHRDELPVRPPGGRVTAMAWSADGKQLAVGAEDGSAALIGFPPQMFK